MAFWPWTDARRRRTARHEAGHVVVARALGAFDLHAVVYDRPNAANEYGRFTGMFDGTAEDEAVILMAGAVASPGCPGPSDLGQVRALLAGSDMTVGQARGEAGRLVRRHRGAIGRTARRLVPPGGGV